MFSNSYFAPILHYLPQHEGYLPKWLLLVSVISFYNTIQSYLTLALTSRVYCGSYPLPIDRLPFSPIPPSPPKSTTTPTAKTSTTTVSNTSPATPLSSRTFGTWTLLTSLVRLYAAYNITNPAIYQLAICTYGVAWWHFMSEWLVFRSTSWGKGLLGPVLVANLSLGWMIREWDFYVGN